VREWRYRDKCYPVVDGAIGDSRYDRAAFAFVAILNQIFEESGAEERAYGVSEGNEFGIVFLTDSLKKVIAKVAGPRGRPATQKELKARAKKASLRGEPPLCRLC
jgi:hypothetical protein